MVYHLFLSVLCRSKNLSYVSINVTHITSNGRNKIDARRNTVSQSIPYDIDRLESNGGEVGTKV